MKDDIIEDNVLSDIAVITGLFILLSPISLGLVVLILGRFII